MGIYEMTESPNTVRDLKQKYEELVNVKSDDKKQLSPHIIEKFDLKVSNIVDNYGSKKENTENQKQLEVVETKTNIMEMIGKYENLTKAAKNGFSHEKKLGSKKVESKEQAPQVEKNLDQVANHELEKEEPRINKSVEKEKDIKQALNQTEGADAENEETGKDANKISELQKKLNLKKEYFKDDRFKKH